jgi:hypothetical protein
MYRCNATLATDTKNHCPISQMYTCLPSISRCTNTFCYHDVMSLVFKSTLRMTPQPTFLKEKVGLTHHYTILSACAPLQLWNISPIYTFSTNFMPLDMPTHVILLHKFPTISNNNMTHVGTVTVLSKRRKPTNLLRNLHFMPCIIRSCSKCVKLFKTKLDQPQTVNFTYEPAGAQNKFQK